MHYEKKADTKGDKENAVSGTRSLKPSLLTRFRDRFLRLDIESSFYAADYG